VPAAPTPPLASPSPQFFFVASSMVLKLCNSQQIPQRCIYANLRYAKVPDVFVLL
jgi:hypothetical protein